MNPRQKNLTYLIEADFEEFDTHLNIIAEKVENKFRDSIFLEYARVSSVILEDIQNHNNRLKRLEGKVRSPMDIDFSFDEKRKICAKFYNLSKKIKDTVYSSPWILKKYSSQINRIARLADSICLYLKQELGLKKIIPDIDIKNLKRQGKLFDKRDGESDKDSK